MTKVITYGTYDLLHHGHVRLLERAKALGDYLIVGVTADDFDKVRGKINVQQPLMARVEAVRKLGIADEIIVEEYEGQKIDDIRRYGIDIFTVGSDWVGKFDYLREYCKVVYLERTKGVSSSEIRQKRRALRLGIIGENIALKKYATESRWVNGLEISGICSKDKRILAEIKREGFRSTRDFATLLKKSDAVYIASHPSLHVSQIRTALDAGKHVLCESPLALTGKDCASLFAIAERNGLVLMDAIKTAYATAYNRLVLMAKDGRIGDIVSVDSTCTSLVNKDMLENGWTWNSSCAWGPTALLPILQLLGTKPKSVQKTSFFANSKKNVDTFSKFDFIYDKAVATAKVGKCVKAEGDLVIAGTKGYIYVPAPWWKTDYYEVRYENPAENKRYFFQLDGEGIRYELVAFLRAISDGKTLTAHIGRSESEKIAQLMTFRQNKEYGYGRIKV